MEELPKAKINFICRWFGHIFAPPQTSIISFCLRCGFERTVITTTMYVYTNEKPIDIDKLGL